MEKICKLKAEKHRINRISEKMYPIILGVALILGIVTLALHWVDRLFFLDQAPGL